MAENKLMFSKCVKLIFSVILIFDQIINSIGSDNPSACGKASSDLVGNENSLHNYPWHTGIYRKNQEYICGGTIISPKVILTAAHCVTNYEGNVEPSENYLVAAGKHYSNYTDARDQNAQYSTVSEIHVPERYKGIVYSFASDIAILILSEPFTLSTAVQPICIEHEEPANSRISLNENSTGIVTGWGYIKPSGPVAEELKKLIIPFVPFDKCYKEVPTQFRKFITIDKICGGYLNKGINVCQGDGGGGFIFKNEVEDRYYIKGVVSTSPSTKELSCDLNQYGTYTSVSHYIDFVKPFLTL